MIRAKAIKQKNKLRLKRKKRIRGNIFGLESSPRVSIFKSNKFIYAQAINDTKSITLCYADSKDLKGVNKDTAAKVGVSLADKLNKLKIDRVVFDRNGYSYHGVVASFADALRENGIKL